MNIKKVLIECNHPTAPFHIRNGWLNVLQYCGFDCRLWNRQTQNIFDAFYEFKPDLFIADSFSLSKDIIKCLLKYPDIKMAFYCSAWGELADKIDSKTHPIVKVANEEKQNIEFLKKQINKPDLMFLHLTDKFVQPVIGKWETELGINVLGMPTAADIFVYNKGTVKPEYQCDIAYIGGYWQYKSRNLDKYIMPLCQYPFKYKTKIFGYSKWSCLNYLGSVKLEEQKDIFASTTICPNIHESHSVDYGFDVVERIFKIPASNGFVISDKVEEVCSLFNSDEIPTFSTYNEFIELIEYFLKNPNKRYSYITKTKNKVLLHHTYFHRIRNLLNKLELKKEADQVWDKYCELMNKEKYFD